MCRAYEAYFLRLGLFLLCVTALAYGIQETFSLPSTY